MSTRSKSWLGMEEEEKAPARKRMRKGTRSCVECRRRKTKCTYEADRPSTCNECQDRGSACVSQYEGGLPTPAKSPQRDHKPSTKERVRNLEDELKRVLEQLQSRDRGAGHAGPGRALDVDTNRPVQSEFEMEPHSGGLATAPTLSLFDNSVIARQEVATTRDRNRHKPHIERDFRLAETLRSMFPNAPTLSLILTSTNSWWTVWRYIMPDMLTAKQVSLAEFVFEELAPKTPRPVKLAKALMCVAVSLNQMPQGFDWRQLNLGCAPEDLMDDYVDAIQRLVLSDDDTACTLEGVETMLLVSKHLIDVGRPRKGWIVLKRTIFLAQLLGLHRMDVDIPTSGDRSAQRSHSCWVALYQIDRLLSLILGLPHAIPDQIVAPAIPPSLQDSPYIQAGYYMIKLMGIAGRIVERNQTPKTMSFSQAMRLEQELEEAKDTIPPGFWDFHEKPDETSEDFQARLFGCMSHNQIREFLHMPFMLRSTANPRYQYSRVAAVESAREMIGCYDALRGHAERYVCKIVDFQAFTAAMLILLNLLGLDREDGKMGGNEDESNDWQRIYRTIAILHLASKEAGGSVAVQAAKALETLASIRDGCPNPPLEHEMGKITIPYFGTLSITHGKHFVLPSTTRRGSTDAGNHGPGSGQITPAVTADYSLGTAQTNASSTTPETLAYNPFISFESSWGDQLGYPGLAGDAPLSGTAAATGAEPPLGSHGSAAAVPKMGLDLDEAWDWSGFGAFPPVGQSGW